MNKYTQSVQSTSTNGVSPPNRKRLTPRERLTGRGRSGGPKLGHAETQSAVSVSSQPAHEKKAVPSTDEEEDALAQLYIGDDEQPTEYLYNAIPADEYDDEPEIVLTPEEQAAEQALFDRLAHAISVGDLRTIDGISANIRPVYFLSAKLRHLLFAVDWHLGRCETPRNPEPLTHYLVAQGAERDLPIEEGRQLLREAAERGAKDCDVPLGTLIDAVRAHYRSRLEQKHVLAIGAAVAKGDDTAVVVHAQMLADETAELDASGPLEPRYGRSLPAPIEKFTLGDLRRQYPTLRPPVIESLVRTGETMNFISYSKIGKSFLAGQLALSIAANVRWLWHFDVTPGRVLLIDNELHRETITYRLDVLAQEMGIVPEEVDSEIEIWPLRGRLRTLAASRAPSNAG
jgi:hypothetical protein